ncbi:hypothetical protein BOSP111201_05640 [Bordetella sputigena]|uniref:hypothetical protein n=1 Tax=Bordetella sputigena TaxID=1416810 RepID=UPI0039EF16C6
MMAAHLRAVDQPFLAGDGRSLCRGLGVSTSKASGTRVVAAGRGEPVSNVGLFHNAGLHERAKVGADVRHRYPLGLMPYPRAG